MPGPWLPDSPISQSLPTTLFNCSQMRKNAAGTQDESQVRAEDNFQYFTGFNSSSTANSYTNKAQALFSLRCPKRDVPMLQAHSAEVTDGEEQDDLAIEAFVKTLTDEELACAHEDLFYIGYVPRLYDDSDSPKMCELWNLLQPVFKWMASNFHGEEVPKEVQFLFSYATNLTLTISQ